MVNRGLGWPAGAGADDHERIGAPADTRVRAPRTGRPFIQVAAGLGAGALVALSLPPWGWWPLAIVGAAVLAALLDGRGARHRFLTGETVGGAYFAVSLYWMHDFTLPGYVVVVVLHASFLAAALLLVPATGGSRWVALPAALVLAEAVRSRWPAGGVPVSGIDLGQAGGPLAPAAALGGRLLVVALVGLAGLALARVARLTRRRDEPGTPRPLLAPALAAAVVVVTPLLGAALQGGSPAGTLDVAAVQGGGRRGFRAVETDPADVFAAQLRASARVSPDRDLVLWPEDVVDVATYADSPQSDALRRLARRLGATLVVGVTEDVGADRFTNFALALSPTGDVLDRYDKVQRVPFGEYVPLRDLIDAVADLSAVPRDAVAGRGPGLLRTPVGSLGMLISYEVFFPGRARAAVAAGGTLLLVPTNASSYRLSQMPGQELAAARLRAWETGRSVVQAAPTGYSAVVDRRGRVRARSGLGRQVVLAVDDVPLRSGRTPYGRTGDLPLLAVAVAAAAGPWAAAARRRHRTPPA